MASRLARTTDESAFTPQAHSAAAPEENNVFFPDTEATPQGKNDKLAQVLTATDANDLAIVSIKRLEIGGHGWLITFRK
jgi:hypothetical protein